MSPSKKQVSLGFEAGEEYTVYGIDSALPDYMLSYRLNQFLRWNLRRIRSFRVFNGKNNPPQDFGLYHEHRDDFADFFLVCPITGQISLATGFTLILRGHIHIYEMESLILKIREIPEIWEVRQFHPDGNSLAKPFRQFVGNLLYDLEYHILTLEKNNHRPNPYLKTCVPKSLQP